MGFKKTVLATCEYKFKAIPAYSDKIYLCHHHRTVFIADGNESEECACLKIRITCVIIDLPLILRIKNIYHCSTYLKLKISFGLCHKIWLKKAS